MAQPMATDPHARASGIPFDPFLHAANREALPLSPPLGAHEELPRAWPAALLQRLRQHSRCGWGELDQPLAPVLALSHPPRVPPQIDIHERSADHLRHAYATAQE